jgi:hypothetical protein
MSREIRSITLLVTKTLNTVDHEVEVKLALTEIRFQPQTLMKMGSRSRYFAMYLSIEDC